MASVLTRALRILCAAPLLPLAVWVTGIIDGDMAAALAKPILHARAIEWEGGSVALINQFYGVEALDQLCRGIAVIFSPPVFGYDEISSWQFFTFLIDLGPIYAIWLLESYRPTNAWTPAYLPTLFTLAAQLFGIGAVGPVFYFLYIAFGPTPSALASAPSQRLTVWNKSSIPPLLSILLLHTNEILSMCLPLSMASRLYWIWAWQMSPLWIGCLNTVLDLSVGPFRPKGSPATALIVLGSISTIVWVFTLLYSPYSLPELFVPKLVEPSTLATFSRRIFQADEVGMLTSTYAWLAYSFVDLYLAGLASAWYSSLVVLALPGLALLIGPGSAIAVGWYMRERALSSPKKKE